MITISKPADVAFIIGAGFNQNAGAYGNEKRYPLVADFANECFEHPVDLDHVEEAFQAAISRRKYVRSEDDPLTKLCVLILGADEKIPSTLCNCLDDPINPYGAFLRKFDSAAFVSFNYDALLEQLLLKLGRWRPEDGFGVHVRAELSAFPEGDAGCMPKVLPDQSRVIVLHLHGSLCVYTEEFDINAGLIKEKESEFVFDYYPFPCFAAAVPGLNNEPFTSRIIAPIPEKAEGLKGQFVQRAYEQAIGVLQRAEHVVAIGYRFNVHDNTSYSPLLKALRGRSIVLVSPDANETANRLASDYAEIDWLPHASTFGAWAQKGFPI